MATLVFHLEDDREIVVPLVDTTTIGSAEGSDLQVEDSSIAPNHAEVAISLTGNYVLRDLGSEAGTYVNGRRIKAQPLCEGDEVAFGRLRGQFVMDDEDRASSLKRENDERDLRRKLEQLNRDYEQSHAKHKLVMSVLQGLGEEEKKRLENLDKLQRAINGAETTLASMGAEVKIAREEAAQGDKLRADNSKLQEEITKSVAKRDTLVAEEEQALAAARKTFEYEKSLSQRQVEELAAKVESSKKELAAVEGMIAAASAAVAEREQARAKAEEAIARAEARHAEVKSSISLSETSLATTTAETHRAQEAHSKALAEQKKEQEALKALSEEKQRATEELTALGQQQATLMASVAALELSIKDMAQRQANGVIALRDRERGLREALKGIEQSKLEQDQIHATSRDLEAKRAELQAEVQVAEARIAELDEASNVRKEQLSALSSRIEKLEEEREAVDSRVKALAGTEESLLQARENLMKARQDHAAFLALMTDRDLRQRELEALEATLKDLAAARAMEDQGLAEVKASFQAFQQESAALAKAAADEREKFNREAAAERQRITTEAFALARDAAADRERFTTESASLAKESDLRREHLAALSKQIQEATARHEELLKLHAEFEGVEAKLREARAVLTREQNQQAEFKTRTNSFMKESEAADARVQKMHMEIKTVIATLASRRGDEADLNKAVARLQAEQVTESKRLEDVRRRAAETERKITDDRAEAERKAAADRAEFEAALEKRRKDIHAQDSQLQAIQSLREEIDALYAKIEAGGEDNAAAALAAWKEARKKKDQLTGLLPKEGGIRVKPQGRTVLVPRSKES